jgi:hypothetical protein
MKKPELSILIVNYNTPQLTIACLTSIVTAKTQHDAWEVIVIDNGSTDSSVQELHTYISRNEVEEWIRVLALPKNIGFAGGNNRGIEKSKGETILLLNSDTEVEKDSIQLAISQLHQDKQTGVVGGYLYVPSGIMDPACHRGFPTPYAAFFYFIGLERLFPHSHVFGKYHQGYKGYDTIHSVDAISGAFFMIKKSVIDVVGLLDESFFMYGEDLDWAYRIKEHGWNIVFDPQVKVLHKKKQSGRSHSDKKIKKVTQYHFYSTMKQFYHKHYEKNYPRLVTNVVYAVLDMRIAMLHVSATSL